MGGPKGPMRGKKTHKFDQKLNRGEHREPAPDMQLADEEKGESRHQERVRDEHPVRKTDTGYKTRGSR